MTRTPPTFIRGLLCALLAVVTLAACSSQKPSGAQPDQAVQKAAARADKTAVVASFYPLSEAAQRVGGERIAVVNLTPPGSEPHYVELNPSTLDQVNRAALVLYLGKGFQPSVEKAAERRGEAALDVLQGLPLQQGVAEEGEEGGAGQTDPHVWLDPTLMSEIVSKVEAALSRVDPAGRDAYAANASRYRAELQQLDTEFRGGLATCARRAIVTSHAAFGYLARRYGLQQQAIAGLSPESEPKPGRLARLAGQVKRDGTTTVFTEPLLSPKVAETFAREAGLKTAVLDPVEGLTEDEVKAGKSYLTVMRENLSTLRPALGCQ